MPRVKVKLPDGLMQKAATRAHDQGKHIDELWGEAIDKYIENNKDMRADAVRSRGNIPGRSPTLTIEISEELFQRGEKLAKRIGKQRDWLYCEALARHVAYNASRDDASAGGHTLPNESALRPKGPT